MKKIIKSTLVLMLAVAFFAPSFAGKVINPNGETFIKVGSKLTYAIDRDGKKYDMVVTITKLSPQISFDWQMTAPANRNGSVTMSEKAVGHAMNVITDFANGATTLNGESAIWLSYDNFYQMKNDRHGIFQLDGKDNASKVVNFNEPPVIVKVNGSDMTMTTLMLHNGIMSADKKIIQVLDSKDFPIILKIEAGWSMTLKSIN
ncbi:MAG: hypothetical protein WCL14_12090 [Bacteroidota bacterium]